MFINLKIKTVYVFKKHTISDGGITISFNPKDDSVYLIGTGEGNVHKCTTEYSSMFTKTYIAHTMPVYNVCWNSYVPTIFLTCAADWFVKLWDQNST